MMSRIFPFSVREVVTYLYVDEHDPTKRKSQCCTGGVGEREFLERCYGVDE